MEMLLFGAVFAVVVLFAIIVGDLGKIKTELQKVGLRTDEMSRALWVLKEGQSLEAVAAFEEEAPGVVAPEPEAESEEILPDPALFESAALSPPPLPSQMESNMVVEPVTVASSTGGQKKGSPPREPSAFETKAKEALAKIWSWMVVGEEHRSENVTREFAIATTWLIRLGVLILVVGIGFFLGYTTSNEALDPMMRVSISALTGVGILIGSIRMMKGVYSLLGQGLAGASFATFYFSFFTAHELGVLGAVVSFVVMGLVTVGAGVVALRFRSLLVAILGMAGGYLTPFMIQTDSPNLIGLFCYVLLLGLGVLFMAGRRDWRILIYLSFVATNLIVFRAVDQGFAPERFWQFMPFLIAYFALFSTAAFVFQVVNREKVTLLELLFLFLNAGVFFWFVRGMIVESFVPEMVAAVTMGIAAYYLLHIQIFLRRRERDKGLMMSFVGLASLFVAITLPILLTDGWVTLSWAIQAFVMLWISHRMQSGFLRQLALVLYALVIGRMLFFDLGFQISQFDRVASPRDYWLALLERMMTFGVPIASFFAAGKLLIKDSEVSSDWLAAGQGELRPWFGQSRLGRVCFWVVVLFTFIVLNIEVKLSLEHFYEPLMRPAMTLVWLGLGIVLIREMFVSRGTLATPLFWILIAALAIKLVTFDLWYWSGSSWLELGFRDPIGDVGMRLINYGAVIAFLIGAWRLFRHEDGDAKLASTFGYMALSVTFLYSSQEVWSALSEFLPRFLMGGISIYWAVFGIGLLWKGISKSHGVLRAIGLILLGGVIVKVFFVDLAGLDQIYRIVAFLILGVVVLFGSFFYLKHRDRFETSKEES